MRLRFPALLILVSYLMGLPGITVAGQIPGLGGISIQIPAPSPTALPVLKSGGTIVGVQSINKSSSNSLEIHQNESKAIIDWSSFDIGENASTHFDQKKHTDWVALNRIWDKNPSQIYGTLTADGKVYLINQNGILFGPNSKVNVHSLVASSLNISNTDFANDVLKLKQDNYQKDLEYTAPGPIENKGRITATTGGSVFLVGSSVSNSGSISAEVGQIGLAAGLEVEVLPDTAVNTSRTSLVVNVKSGAGTVVNEAGSLVEANYGQVGAYGSEIIQDGTLRAVCSVKQSGSIELNASDRIKTGTNSITECPVTDSQEEVHSSFVFQPGTIRLQGLDPSNPANPETPVKIIEHYGTIRAPSGAVSLYGGDRVFLESGSTIDVSGLWLYKAVDTNLLQSQLNSVELKDDYGQKSGSLKGETVSFASMYGSAVGDVSGALKSEQRTAQELATTGGSIDIFAATGETIVKSGALLDFSGGGIHYGQGYLDTTKLVSGNKVYDISSAPEWLQYELIMDESHPFVKKYERFGVADSYSGLYFGGGTPVRNFATSYTEGADAGTLTLNGRQVILNGIIDGSVREGIFQVQESGSDSTDENGYTTAVGLNEPTGGTLIIGGVLPVGGTANDLTVGEIVVTDRVDSLPDTFGANDTVPVVSRYSDGTGAIPTTYLAAESINSAGLSNVQLNANTSIKIDSQAHIELAAGAQFRALARRIEHEGSIDIPAGSVTFAIKDNVTTPVTVETSGEANPNHVSLQERVYLAAGSEIDVSGRKVDNSTAESSGSYVIIGENHINGGEINILDSHFPAANTPADGIFVDRKATLDVSGGYVIDEEGKVTGGDAGTIVMQGKTIVLDGQLKGYSLVGNDGGKIVLYAHNITVAQSALALPEGFNADSELPEDFATGLTLAANRFDTTGFTQIELKSLGNLQVEQGATVSPSRAKLAQPVSSQISNSEQAASDWQASAETTSYAGNGIIAVNEDQIGTTSFKGYAGVLFQGAPITEVEDSSARIVMAADSAIHVAMGGTIAFEGPGVEVSGLLDAPGGQVSLKAGLGDLVIGEAGRIFAGGYKYLSSEDPIAKGLPAVYDVIDGGSISLSVPQGNLRLASGSVLDVSGSSPAEKYLRNSDGTVSSEKVAGAAGTINLLFEKELELGATLNGHAGMKNASGATLTVSQAGNSGELLLSQDYLDRFTGGGFDDLTFLSWNKLRMDGDINTAVGRKLTLDAPLIDLDGHSVVMNAPWIVVKNSYSEYPEDRKISSGTGELKLSGKWLEIEGSVGLAGGQSVSLAAENDLMLSDAEYTSSSKVKWEGLLDTSADVTIQAARVYPTTSSNFTIRTDGKVTILGNGADTTAAIPSAGGSLTIEAHDIEHRGYLAAPLGSITLSVSDGRIYLGEESTTTTRSDMACKYGDISDLLFWTALDKSTDLAADVQQAPEKSINIDAGAGEVIVHEGATLDISGGGSIFSYLFQPGTEGTANPLTKTGRYVLVPSGSINLPGAAVHLEGGNGIAEGTYCLLPEEYAFLPGALVITDLGANSGWSGYDQPVQGLGVVSGYFTTMGTTLKESETHRFSVRTAADVLKEGHFEVQTFTAGDAGNLSISGNSVVLDGSVIGTPLPNFNGGTVSLSGKDVIIGGSSKPRAVPDDFSTPLNKEYEGKLYLAADSLKGFRELSIGKVDLTNTVTMEGGSLEAENVNLSAKTSITLNSGAEINAVGDEGSVGLTSPKGKVTIAGGAKVHATHEVDVDAMQIDLKGELEIDNSRLKLASDKIFILPAGLTEGGSDGLYITAGLWSKFAGIENISIQSRSDIVFLGDMDWTAGGELTLDAGRILGSESSSLVPGADGKANVTITAVGVNLLNTGSASTETVAGGTGSFTVNASKISIGHGDLVLDGFGTVQLNSEGDTAFRGKGSFKVNADLTLKSARTAASLYESVDSNGKTTYEVADFEVNAGDGVVRLAASGGAAGSVSQLGGSIDIAGKTIESSGHLEITSGILELHATGTDAGDGIYLKSGSTISGLGSAYAPGSLVRLDAGDGVLSIDAGASIDVSNQYGDAGTIELLGPKGGVVLDGTLKGTGGAGGKGGSFMMDAREVTRFSAINEKLSSGGFNRKIDIRARDNDLEIEAGTTVKAEEVSLAADAGDITVRGGIDASGTSGGGKVELFAGNNVNLKAGSKIDASGTGADAPGGEVLISASSGAINMEAGTGELAAATVDVSGTSDVQGGTVHFRAQRDGNDVKMNLAGKIIGDGKTDIIIEPFRVYDDTDNPDHAVTSADITKWIYDPSAAESDTESFMENAAAIRNRLLAGVQKEGWTDTRLRVLPGIEVRSDGDLTISDEIDLTSYVDADGVHVPGFLTLRAAGNLSITQSLVDHPTSAYDLASGAYWQDSWGYTLTAGADLTAANPLAFTPGSGNLQLSDGILVYTESAPIQFAAGGNVSIGPGRPNYFDSYMLDMGTPYSLASFDGSILGRVGGDLVIRGGAVETATGDIDIDIRGDLQLLTAPDFEAFGSDQTSLGSIRTTGSPADGLQASLYWKYADGGDITLTVGGSVNGGFASNAWDHLYSYYVDGERVSVLMASYEMDNTTEGIVTMAGGNLTVRTGGDFSCQIGTFGTGDLTVLSGGNIGGRFMIKDGSATLHALGNFGSDQAKPVIEAYDARIDVGAQGDLVLGAVVNPSVASPQRSGWDLLYTEDSSVTLKSLLGNVSLYGNSSYYQNSENENLERILPPTLDIEAGGDILLCNQFVLAPSSVGQLRLVAGGDIDGEYFDKDGYAQRAQILLSDMDPSAVYGSQAEMNFTQFSSRYGHAATPIHENDSTPAEIHAGEDIRNVALFLPKEAFVSAGRDISDIYYFGQNVNSGDVTLISAGRDLLFSSTGESNLDTGINLSGPGFLTVTAGNLIDLGTTTGIQTSGNLLNLNLSDSGSSIIVVSGFNLAAEPLEVKNFFVDLQKMGVDYSTLLANGDTAAALERVKQAQETLIDPFLGTPSGQGDIDMVRSQITTADGGDIFVLAANDINVGVSTITTSSTGESDSSQSDNTGINTQSGGAINIYSKKDINVNESRVMTWLGGDITLWSEEGSINAGRGSKTAVNTSKPQRVNIGTPQNPQYVTRRKPAAVGSGIRALTYDPDGVEGPETAPLPGDIYLFAPRGVIDAGEAGISGGKVILGATEVLNVQNISFSAGSVGVPTTADTGIAVGALSGVSNLTEQNKMLDQASGMAAAREQLAKDGTAGLGEQMMAWVDVKVISFETDDRMGEE